MTNPIDSHGHPVLIQKDGAGLYLQSPDVWVEEREAARVFADTFEALDYCRAHNLTGFVLAVQLD